MAEIGRTTTAIVSAYDRNRAHSSMLVRGESRSLVANFNGAIPADSLIVSVIWRCQQPTSVVMSDAAISEDQRQTNVTITAQETWGSPLKVSATLDTGQVYTQVFEVGVSGCPYFQGEQYVSAQGPYELTATA